MTMNPFNPPYTGGAPFALPVPNGREITGYLTDEGAQEIVQLLTLTTRNPNRCISKGQLKDAAEKLMAQNLILGKEVERLRAELAKVPSGVFLQMAVDLLNKTKAWRDCEGNDGFPQDVREGMDALLTAIELRERGGR